MLNVGDRAPAFTSVNQHEDKEQLTAHTGQRVRRLADKTGASPTGRIEGTWPRIKPVESPTRLLDRVRKREHSKGALS